MSVQYTSQQALYFAPVLGFSHQSPVTTTATASWGLGSNNPVPIVLSSLLGTGACPVPRAGHRRSARRAPSGTTTTAWEEATSRSSASIRPDGTWHRAPSATSPVARTRSPTGSAAHGRRASRSTGPIRRTSAPTPASRAWGAGPRSGARSRRSRGARGISRSTGRARDLRSPALPRRGRSTRTTRSTSTTSSGSRRSRSSTSSTRNRPVAKRPRTQPAPGSRTPMSRRGSTTGSPWGPSCAARTRCRRASRWMRSRP